MNKFVTLHGFGGGGGTELNFEIVAYSTEEELLADTPAENTIGVVTTTPITDYIFSYTQPSTTIEGRVWISTSTSSTGEFNALKKNSIQVYPFAARQYVSGKWVNKTAMSYQDGVWVEWIKTLFDNGSKVPLSIASEYNTYATIGTKKITIDGGSKTNPRWPVVYTTNKINISGFTKLKATVKYISGDVAGQETYGPCVGVHPTVSQDMSGFEAFYIPNDETEIELEVNISNVSGERYILFGCYCAKYEFTKIWLE